MIRRLVAVLLVAGVAWTGGRVLAADAPQPLYTRLMEKYPAPDLARIKSTMLKFLIDADKVKPVPEQAFPELWARIKASAAKNGFVIQERKEDTFQTEPSYQEYLDTADQALWAKGYLIRIIKFTSTGKTASRHGLGSVKRGGGDMVELTFKNIRPDFKATLLTPLAVAGVDEVKRKPENNVGIGYDGQLSCYVENTASFYVALDDSRELRLGDFTRYLPELGGLGIPAGTVLQVKRAYSLEVDPGSVQLAGAKKPVRISIAAWSATPGGKPFLYDFSVTYKFKDFYADARTHASGERFLAEAIYKGLADVGTDDEAKWCGSKVRKFMNWPMPRP
jgi:hypothetical protein